MLTSCDQNFVEFVNGDEGDGAWGQILFSGRKPPPFARLHVLLSLAKTFEFMRNEAAVFLFTPGIHSNQVPESAITMLHVSNVAILF
jgi:hypothetical protein